MTDLTWLAEQARNIHTFFASIFYLMVTVFLLIGVLIEYGKLPIGGVPTFSSLIGRALIAAILLHTLPDVMHLLADLADGLSTKMGADPNFFNNVRSKLAEKSTHFFWWRSSLKETIVVLSSYVTLVIFHFSFYLADAFFLYTWTFLYILSPVLIALYVLPVTAPATTALYRSLIEVSCWKPIWFLTATLLWSTANSDLGKPGNDANILSVICYNLILAGSLLAVPFVVHSLAGGGLAQFTRHFGSISIGATVLGPRSLVRFAGNVGKPTYNAALDTGSMATRRYFPRAHKAIQKVPRFHIPPSPPLFTKAKDPKDKKPKEKETT
jgi:hypothetical protein